MIIKFSVCNLMCKDRYVDGAKVSSSFISNDADLSYSVLYYWAMKRTHTFNNEVSFTINGIIEMVSEYIDIRTNERRHRAYIHKSIRKLLDVGLISNFKNIDMDSISPNQWLTFRFENDTEKNNGFFFLDEQEILDIVSYKGNVNMIQLFNSYCFISSFIFTPKEDDKRVKDEQYKTYYIPMRFFVENNIVKNQSTILSYFEILSGELNLIRYQNAGEMYIKNKNNSDKMSINYFILRKDYNGYSEDDINNLFKNILRSYKADKRAEGYSFKTKAHSKNANNKRKTTMKGDMEAECGK